MTRVSFGQNQICFASFSPFGHTKEVKASVVYFKNIESEVACAVALKWLFDNNVHLQVNLLVHPTEVFMNVQLENTVNPNCPS